MKRIYYFNIKFYICIILLFILILLDQWTNLSRKKVHNAIFHIFVNRCLNWYSIRLIQWELGCHVTSLSEHYYRIREDCINATKSINRTDGLRKNSHQRARRLRLIPRLHWFYRVCILHMSVNDRFISRAHSRNRPKFRLNCRTELRRTWSVFNVGSRSIYECFDRPPACLATSTLSLLLSARSFVRKMRHIINKCTIKRLTIHLTLRFLTLHLFCNQYIHN